MGKNNSDLFDRLRRAGLRKEAAKALSQISTDAGKKALRAAREAAHELRTLADEIEHRIGGAASNGRQSQPAQTKSRPASANAKPASGNGPARSSPGENQAMILASLQTGQKTAAEIAKEAGIPPGTVGGTLRRLASTGEVVKALRGYALPS
jgi:hypothetical protein